VSELTATGRIRADALTGALTAAVYVFLGGILCWSRLVGLDRGYASDELRTVREYVREGPREILVGPYVPNNHELFSLLGWATTSVVGESEIALRLWSAIPFLIGVAVVTAWLHVRLGPLSGLLFLFFATASPLLLDITRQARGYGLAFLAMSVLTVAALEAERSRKTWAIVAFCSAGLVGTLTLPNFSVAFAATGFVLLVNRDLRRRVGLGLAASLVAVAIAYAPHLHDLFESSRQPYGAPIDDAWIVTAPIDQTLIPAFAWIDEALMDPGLVSLVIAAGLVLIIGSSPLARSRRTALVLGTGVVATVVTFWITGTNVAPRFFSFLLVPLFILLASGAAAILARLADGRPAVLRTVVVMTTLGLVALIAAPWLTKITRLPREAVRDVAAAIDADAAPSAPVFAHIPYPGDLEFYLGRPVVSVSASETERACDASRDAVFVTQEWILPAATLPCADRDGVRVFRFEQYARGGEIRVWFVPPERRP
jgi:hypothetical protein